MELGISTFAETLPDPHTGRTITHAERLRDIIGEMEMAEKAASMSMPSGSTTAQIMPSPPPK